MKTNVSRWMVGMAAGALLCGVSVAQSVAPENRQIGTDANSALNPVVQPQDPALAGGGIDQSMQFGDVLFGTSESDLLIGLLGTDILMGGAGDDVLLGGSEHFNPFNRDRAFGGPGNDVFLWSPGDGSDLFDGGPGRFDTIIFGLLGEIIDGELNFGVRFDQQAGNVFVDAETGLPAMDVPGSPGFCEVVDRSDGEEVAAELDRLGLDHLVRFRLRGLANSFEAGEQDTDNGVRVTLHLKDVEFVICTTREGGDFEIIDLTQTPPAPASFSIADQAILDLIDNPNFPN